jgi:hypothetical protein
VVRTSDHGFLVALPRCRPLEGYGDDGIGGRGIAPKRMAARDIERGGV